MSSETSRKATFEVFRVTGYRLTWMVLPLPTVAFILCVSMSIINNYEAATRTHCGVKNYLPSISVSIGDFTPQRYIWRICIALHCAPRFLVAVSFYNYYRSYKVRKWPDLYDLLAAINSFLHILENLALVTLSFVSSSENYPIHEKSFISFVVFSQFYMLLTCILYRWSHGASMTRAERRSYNWKRALFASNLSVLLLSAYFFYRHVTYCEPGMNSLFALCEYLTVTCNIMYNGSCWIMDLGDTVVVMLKNRKQTYATL